MARPKRFRFLEATPVVTRFLPERAAGPSRHTVHLRLDEFEALRLADLEGLSQEEAAERMKISRATFGRIAESARRAVVEALVHGHVLEIGGGMYRYARRGRLLCPRCRHTQPVVSSARRTITCRRCIHPLQGVEPLSADSTREETIMDIRNATIAVVTEDGKTVSAHFGRAPHYEVLTFRDGNVIARERREKFAPHLRGGEHGEGRHHHGAKHHSMLEPIRDCQVVIARGMGDGAYTHLTESGLMTVVTDLHTVDEVAQAVASGSLQHDAGRVHHKQHAHGQPSRSRQ